MNVSKAGLSLRSMVLTPEKIPRFLVPSPACRASSPLLLLCSPRRRASFADRGRLLSDPSTASSPELSPDPRRRRPGTPATSRFLRPPTAGFVARIRRRLSGEVAAADADTDLSTRAAMSLPHVDKVTTPYGFRAVLAASPCTRRRESIFHRRPVVSVLAATEEQPSAAAPEEQPPPPRGMSARAAAAAAAARARGAQVMRALTPARRRAQHR
ncbi:unnamed protein product [Merluccius merluccius]